jgi:hypothetical protein
MKLIAYSDNLAQGFRIYDNEAWLDIETRLRTVTKELSYSVSDDSGKCINNEYFNGKELLLYLDVFDIDEDQYKVLNLIMVDNKFGLFPNLLKMIDETD